MKHSITLLITIDIHCYPAIAKELPMLIEETLRLFSDFSIKATFFFPAIFAEQFANPVRKILNAGHEIGCHGLTHDPVKEQYNSMSYERQRSILYEAKKRIEEVASKQIISFRAPAFKINGATIRALEENGFKADLSVNPQRLSVFSSTLGNIGWMYSPRIPYHPDFANPFKKGTSSLWEIPQSSFIFPFTSNSGVVFGEAFMKLFFKILYIESNLRNNPIVYMIHVEDIYPREVKHTYKFKWRHLFPSKVHGFEFRYIFFRNKDGKSISRQNINLLEMMRNYKNIELITVKDTVDLLEEKNKSNKV